MGWVRQENQKRKKKKWEKRGGRQRVEGATTEQPDLEHVGVRNRHRQCDDDDASEFIGYIWTLRGGATANYVRYLFMWLFVVKEPWKEF